MNYFIGQISKVVQKLYVGGNGVSLRDAISDFLNFGATNKEREEFAEYKSNTQRTITELSALNETLKEENRSLDVQHHNLESKIDTLVLTNEQLKEENSQLKESVNDYLETIKNLDETNSSNKSIIERLEKSLNDTKTKDFDLIHKIKDRDKRYDELSLKVTKLELENDELRNKLESQPSITKKEPKPILNIETIETLIEMVKNKKRNIRKSSTDYVEKHKMCDRLISKLYLIHKSFEKVNDNN